MPGTAGAGIRVKVEPPEVASNLSSSDKIPTDVSVGAPSGTDYYVSTLDESDIITLRCCTHDVLVRI